MKKLIFLIYLIKFGCYGIIVDDTFSNRKRDDLPLPIMIGGYPYTYSKIIKNYSVFDTVPYSQRLKNLPYPNEYDFPKFIFPNDNLVRKLFENKGNAIPTLQTASMLENIINDLTNGKLLPMFTLNYALSIHPPSPFDTQILFLWNSNVTFMILIFKEELLFDINLGRGIDKYNISNDLPETDKRHGRQIYEISTSRMKRIGCQSYKEDEKVRDTFEISMNKYRFSGLGNEEVILQGPCIKELVIVQPIKIKIQNSNTRELASLSLNPISKLNVFNFTTPMLWYPGIYEFTFKFMNIDFTSKVEIYIPINSQENYRLLWNGSEQMNNPNFNLDRITLVLPSRVSNYKHFTFNIINWPESDKMKEVEIYSVKSIPIDDKDDRAYLEIEVKELYLAEVNISQHLGFMFVTDHENKKEWTRLFSLVWMKYYNNPTSDNDCLQILSKPAQQKIHFCPENSKMAEGLLSTFKRVDFDVDLVKDNLDKYTCFAQILTDLDGRGVTCCYFKDSQFLVYGQDFQLRNDSYSGSYTWTTSPFQKPYIHFLNDRLPILSCCVFISNDSLCADYWNKFHKINIIKSKSDHRGDICGDPHIIPFKSSSNFSFLGLGQYNIILTSDNKFTLQGRFHYIKEEGQSSFLKVIAFHLPETDVVIAPSSNSLTDLKWKILLNNITNRIISLPFQSENLFMFQNSDGTNLKIWVYLPENFRIFIELDRFHYDYGVLEYMNMKISLSNNFKNIITGGLFGKIDERRDSSALYKEDSTNPLPLSSLRNNKEMFEFVMTWKLTDKYPKLFFDMEYLVPDDIYLSFTFINKPECDNFIPCSIDKSNFERDNIHLRTQDAYKFRWKLDNDWESSLIVGSVCDRPNWKFLQLNSSNFMESETVQVLNCSNSSLMMSNKYQELTCKMNPLRIMEWVPNPSFQGEFCRESSEEKPKTDQLNAVLLYSSVTGSIFIIFIIITILLICVILRKKRKFSINKSNDLSLTTTTEIDLGSIYDNNIRLNESDYDHYYAKIQKPAKSENF